MSSARGCLLLLAALVSFCHFTSATEDNDEGGHDFDSDKFPNCGGMYQSPVNVALQQTEYGQQYNDFSFRGYSSPPAGVSYKIINRGHTVQVTAVNNTNLVGVEAGGLQPSYYNFIQFHFHWGSRNGIGSEHTVDGRRYPMEIHLVHYNPMYTNVTEAANQTDGLAVLGSFVEIGDDNNTAINQVIQHFDSIRHLNRTVDSIDPISLNGLLPENKNKYFRYNGSLTTDPCYESVTWTVFREPVRISQYQMDAFRKIYRYEETNQNNMHIRNNFRPVKPLNGRTIYRSYQELDVQTTATPTADETTSAATTSAADSFYRSASRLLLFAVIVAFLGLAMTA